MTYQQQLNLLQDAVVRIEKKLDEVLKALRNTVPGSFYQPLNVPAQGTCPLCQMEVTYITVDGVTTRKCMCKPVSIDFTDQQETPDGY